MGCRIDNIFIGCIAYADDILLLSASVVHLHKMLGLIERSHYVNTFSLRVRSLLLDLILRNRVYLLLVKIIRNSWPIFILVTDILHGLTL